MATSRCSRLFAEDVARREDVLAPYARDKLGRSYPAAQHAVRMAA